MTTTPPTRTATPHPLPVKPPKPRAHMLVMISQSAPHAAVYAAHRWGGIGTTYGKPGKELGYSSIVVRFPATKLGAAQPRDSMSLAEQDDFDEASRIGIPFVPYMLPPPKAESSWWLAQYVPARHTMYIDEGCGLPLRDPEMWNAIVEYGKRFNTTIGIEPLPDRNIPEQHHCPSIVWWSLWMQGNPNWLLPEKRKAEMLMVLDIQDPTREELIETGRRVSSLGFSPVLPADLAVGFKISAKELLG